jgi:hypothetical protein
MAVERRARSDGGLAATRDEFDRDPMLINTPDGVLLRLQDLAAHLLRPGPRSVYEFTREIVAVADIFEQLERYARLDPNVVRAIGADRMPPRVVLIQRGSR